MFLQIKALFKTALGIILGSIILILAAAVWLAALLKRRREAARSRPDLSV